MTRPGLPAAAALTAIAAWLSFSTLAVAADGARIGLLPLSLSALIFTLAAVAAVVRWREPALRSLRSRC